MIRAIWAQATNQTIGNGEDLLWYLPEDLQHFKELTVGSAVVMGYKTWQSLPQSYKPLPGRDNLVLTRNKDKLSGVPGVRAISLDEIPQDCWIIGGGEIYQLTLSMVDEIYVTEVNYTAQGEVVYAPKIDDGFSVEHITTWRRSPHGYVRGSSRKGLYYRFVTYKKQGEQTNRNYLP